MRLATYIINPPSACSTLGRVLDAPGIPPDPTHSRVADLQQEGWLLDPALAVRNLLGRRRVAHIHVVPAWLNKGRTLGQGTDRHARLADWARTETDAPPSPFQAPRTPLPTHQSVLDTSPLITSLVGRSGVLELPLM